MLSFYPVCATCIEELANSCACFEASRLDVCSDVLRILGHSVAFVAAAI